MRASRQTTRETSPLISAEPSTRGRGDGSPDGLDRVGRPLDERLRLLLRDRERGADHDDVAVDAVRASGARIQHQLALARVLQYAFGDSLAPRERRLRRSVAD